MGQKEGPTGIPEIQHNEALMPMTLGPACRVPDYAYPNWGLVYEGEGQANAAYQREWAAGNAGQLGLVSKATIEAGFGDFPELLRRETAKTVAALLKDREDDQELRILDIGAGPGLSALAVYEALRPRLKSRTTMILVDPSKGSLETAAQLMRDRGIKFEILTGIDSDVLGSVEPGSVDILTGVASIHHHAKIPFKKYQEVLKAGGFAVFGDWHQSIWEHPGSVYEFLKRFSWPEREKGLRNFLEIYPEAKSVPLFPKSPEDRKAVEQITQFWLACKRIANGANLELNAIWPLEGHRPVGRYVEGMEEVGLKVGKPRQILDDSSLLQVTVGQKIINVAK